MPCSVIEVKASVPAPSRAAHLAHCRARLAQINCPREVVTFEVSYNATAKIQKLYVLPELYDYHFAVLKTPGLTLDLRYVKGGQTDPEEIGSVKGRALRTVGWEGKEWARTTDLVCVMQSGTFKNVC